MASRSLRRALLALTLLGAWTLAPQRVGAEEPAWQAPLGAAERALAEGRTEEAVEGFRVLLSEATSGALEPAVRDRVRRGLGVALLRSGETYAALEPLEALAQAGAPADLTAYAGALLAHVRATLDAGSATRTQVTPFLEDARRALARIPDERAGEVGRAWFAGEEAYLAGRLEEAVQAWSTAPATGVDEAERRWYRERLAHALYQLHRPREAAEVYEALGNQHAAAAAWTASREGERALAGYLALLKAAPGDRALLEEALAAARFLDAQRTWEAALATLTSEDPAQRSGWAVARARLLVQVADFGAARTVLLGAKPGLTGPLLAALDHELAATLLLAGTGGETARAEAGAALLEGWAAEPGREDLARLMGFMAEQDFRAAPRLWPDRRPLERALALQRALTQAASDDPMLLANLGNVARLAGATEEAVRSLEQALALAPGDAALANDLALALLAAERKADAEAALRTALAADPAFLAARQNLARLLGLASPASCAEARDLLLGAEAAAREAGAPAVVYRALALRAWRAARRAAQAPGR